MSNAQSVTHHLLTDAQSLANQQLPPSQVLWSCCSVGHHRVLGQFGSAVWVLSLPSSLLRLRSAWLCLSTTLQQSKHQCVTTGVLMVIQIQHHVTY